jgi:hypothetical protein
MNGLTCARFVLMLLALALSAAAAAQTAPVASLDRQQVRLGETVTLQVVAEGQNLPTPDFTPLAVDFELLGRSTSSQLSMIGGQTVARTTWSIELEPLRAGILRIPPLPVGAKATAPLALTVIDAPAAAEGEAEDIFIELEVEPQDPYVHQPVKVVLRLYYAVGLTEGNLREPEIVGAALARVGQDRNYAAERHGRRYQVVERVFSLRPERSGELRIGPAQFQGRALRQGARRSLMDPGVRVIARSEPQRLNVKPRPAAAQGGWLPARSLHIEDTLGPDPDRGQVGEPLTRTVRLLAEGVALDQLPDLDHPDLPSAQVYADRPIGHGRESGGWPSAEREFRFAVVPGQAGELVLPELRVAWWDVVADAPREAVLPARSVQVAPAAGAPVAVAGRDLEGLAGTEDAVPPHTTPGPWPWLSGALGGLWLATLGGWWWTSRRARAVDDVEDSGGVRDSRAVSEAYRRALQREDAGATLSALLAWAQVRDASIRHFAELRARLADPAQQQALDALERARYGLQGDMRPALWSDLKRAFRDGPDLGQGDEAASSIGGGALPPLWPQRS